MKRLLLAIPLMLGGIPAMAQMNPYQIGMQYCQMINSGMSRKKAWDYSIQSYANTSSYGVNQGDPFAPWSPTRSLGGAIGSGIASGLTMGLQLRGMKGDIQKVINSNCPSQNPTNGQSAYKNENSAACKDSSVSAYMKRYFGCNEASINSSKKEPSSQCHVNLAKFDCSYLKYLDANPAVSKWANLNPLLAKKEAIRLKASDAEKVGTEQNVKEITPATKVHSKDDLEEKCLKAVDYRGCMIYSKSN